MSSRHHHSTHFSGHDPSWSHMVGAVITGVRDWAARHADQVHRAWVRSRTMTALASLDDDRLDDIGVRRGDIEGFVRDLERGVDRRHPNG